MTGGLTLLALTKIAIDSLKNNCLIIYIFSGFLNFDKVRELQHQFYFFFAKQNKTRNSADIFT